MADPSPMLYHVTAEYVDFEGETATVSFFMDINDDQPGTAVDTLVSDKVALISALTNCNLVGYNWAHSYYGTGLTPSHDVTAEPYANVEEKLFMKMAAINGNTITMNVPGPHKTLFIGDGETWDPTATTLATFLTDWAAVDDTTAGRVTDNDGTKWKEGVFGYRRRAKSRREKPGRRSALG